MLLFWPLCPRFQLPVFVFGESTERRKKNLFSHCFREIFSPLFFPCFSFLWCRDDGWALRVTVFIEMEIVSIVLSLLILIWILLKTWLWQACHTSRVQSISWLHVSFPFQMINVLCWVKHTLLGNLQWDSSCVFWRERCRDLHCSLWCHTKTE